MEKKMKLTGTILGVDFDVVLTGTVGNGPEKLSGTAGGHPVELSVAFDNKDSAKLTGSLLGKPIEINLSE